LKINGNSALHFFVLGGVLAALPLIHPRFLVLDALIWAALREQAQHRYILTKAPDDRCKKYWTAEKRTFFDFGWLGKKQWQEIAETTLGAALLVETFLFFA
jgi:hypothetical protein